MASSTRVAIALGSNLGERETHLAFAIERLGQILTDIRVSRFHETEPVGVGPQPRFLNAVLTGMTALSARELLALLLAIERDRGRTRPHPGAARTLDLDLILFGDEEIDEPGLQVPHPRFREREFVLAPLAEIAGDWIDPRSRRSVAEILAELRTKN